jgi:hypothetical protein
LIATGCATASVFSAVLSCLLAKVQLDRRNQKLAGTFLQGVVRLLLDSVSTGSVNWAQQAIGGEFLVEFSKGE